MDAWIPADLQREAMLGPLLGLIFLYALFEFGLLYFRGRRANLREYRMAGFAVLWLAVGGGLLASVMRPMATFAAASAGNAIVPFDTGLGWPWWIYGLVVYEFFYWVQHWAAHKVRLLWCVHAPHHTPESINMAVGFNHFFLESLVYMPFVLGFFPALLGVHPALLAIISTIDVVWGNFLHISDGVVRFRYGPLERFLQTPSYHRVHHAQNIRYMDTNYTSITLLWDWLLGTLEPLRDEEPVRYGVTRNVDTGSFRDVHFGEWRSLWRDLRAASSMRERLQLLIRPPGWRAGDDSQTVAAKKASAFGD
jgi:sterol desaturase/sphingolipid hydroxylase (fatty acid hydroxylase superfamily)